MVIIFLIIIICHSSHSVDNNDKTLDITIYDNTIEVDRLLYGDITKMDDLYLPDINNTDKLYYISESKIKEEIKKSNNKNNNNNPTWNLDDLNSSNMKKFHDIKEFNDITKSIRNITKNYTNLKPGPLTRRYWYQDIEDGTEEYYSYYYKYYKETEKKERLMYIMITFLIHARYQIKKALTAKHHIREDKRYRIGFLFNRLAHLQYEQRKIVSSVHNQFDYKHKDFYNLMKLYEKVIRLDVDIIDTIEYIRSVDGEQDAYIPFRVEQGKA